jgi:hypothetical protein
MHCANESSPGEQSLKNVSPNEGARTQLRRWLGWTWLAAVLLTFCFFALPRVPHTTVQGHADRHSTTEIQTVARTKNIEDIGVGDRVVADAGDAADKALDLFGVAGSWDSEPVDRSTWKKITFICHADGAPVDIVLLRPLAWIEETGARVGQTVHLILPEQAVDGGV